jgi:type IX secretion system PorP/SprF family membrane protein
MHFSQFTNATMHLSPAAVGMMDDKARINLQYRSQWAPLLGSNGAYKTLAATFEKRQNVKSTDFFGWGIGIWTDKSGSALRHDEAKASIAYARKMGGGNRQAHFLVGGFQLGVFQKAIDLNGREWISQHDGNGNHDPSRLGGTVSAYSRVAADISMGLGWYSTFGRYNNSIMGGFALQHLNRPEVSVDNSSFQNLYIRTTYHLAADIRLARFFNVTPSAMMMQQGPSREIMVGSGIKAVLREPNRASVQLGAWLRVVNQLEGGTLNDAWVLLARFDWKQYGIGFSYDINTSLLREFNSSNHSIELLLTYRFTNAEYDQQRVITPRFL